MNELVELHNRFMDECIRPLITDQSRALIQKHIEQNDTLLIITATNLFITEPIAEELGIPNILATDPEMIDNRYRVRCMAHCALEKEKLNG